MGAAAARSTEELDIGFVPVVEEQRHAPGTLTDSRPRIRLAAKARQAKSEVKEALTCEVVYCARAMNWNAPWPS